MAGGESAKKILVIEDDDVYRELLEYALAREGYRVVTASNGAKALPLVEEEKPDAVLLDLLMPVMDGLTFLHWLKEEAKLRLPALVITGLENRAFVVEAMVAGASDVLLKPVALPTLLEKLERIL